MAELKALMDPPLIDLAPMMDDFADAAALVAQLDLVIMTDSAVAHLAGALGTPVWLALNPAPYWLWLEKKNQSMWYDSAKLFRQIIWNDWVNIFDRMSTNLLSLSNN